MPIEEHQIFLKIDSCEADDLIAQSHTTAFVPDIWGKLRRSESSTR
jgi:hypothetical protein